jgi:hypothetical protein
MRPATKNQPILTEVSAPETWEFELVSPARLFSRWSWGSPSTLRRARRDGLLVPRRRSRKLGYLWRDIWAFEGGQPPAGLEAEYREDLLTPDQAMQLTPYRAGWLIDQANAGVLPHRCCGRFVRFVPAEFMRWLGTWDASPISDPNAENGQ